MKVCLYSSIADESLFDRIGFYRDDITALKFGGAQVIATSSLRNLLRFRPQMIVSYFYTKSIFSAMLGRVIGAQVILTGGADQISPALLGGYRLLVHRILAFVCLILAHRLLLSCSDDFHNYRKLCCGLQGLASKLELVNHVVIPAPKSHFLNVNKPRNFDAFTLCWMGSEGNVRRKGVDRAVRFIGLLRKIGVDAKLNIAGTDGPGRLMIEKLIKELDLSEQIHLLGAITEDEKSSRMANDHVYLQLSEHEGFGVAAAEAFFSGMIIIHSNRGGLRDVIGERGLIVDLAMIDKEDINAVKNFYSDFKRFKIDEEYLRNNIDKYSIKSRSDAFFR